MIAQMMTKRMKLMIDENSEHLLKRRSFCQHITGGATRLCHSHEIKTSDCDVSSWLDSPAIGIQVEFPISVAGWVALCFSNYFWAPLLSFLSKVCFVVQ